MELFNPPSQALIERNTHLFSGNGDYLGGLYVNEPPQISNAAFYRICTHFLHSPPSHPPSTWSIHRINEANELESNPTPRSGSSLEKGRYVLLGPSREKIPLTISDEPALHRLATPEPRERPDPLDPSYPKNKRYFEDRVLARDNNVCAITGLPEEPGSRLETLLATHIFPESMRESWVRNGYGGKWICDDPDVARDERGDRLDGPDRLFSPRNGLLLDLSAKHSWAKFKLTVDPDDGYRCVMFRQDTRNQAGRTLNPTATDDTRGDRVSDECLRWHYHQAVLIAVRGTADDFGWDNDVLYENPRDFGDYDEEDLDKERESVKRVLEWEDMIQRG